MDSKSSRSTCQVGDHIPRAPLELGLHPLDLEYLQPPHPWRGMRLKRAKPGPLHRAVCCSLNKDAWPRREWKEHSVLFFCPGCGAQPPPAAGRKGCLSLIRTRRRVTLAALESSEIRRSPDNLTDRHGRPWDAMEAPREGICVLTLAARVRLLLGRPPSPFSSPRTFLQKHTHSFHIVKSSC